MKSLLSVLCIGALLLGSCRSVPAPGSHRAPPLPLLLTVEQARHHGLAVSAPEHTPGPAPENALSAAAVVQAGDVKAYAVGRTVDPRDPALLHEAHVVYRQETTPRWRLHAPADQRILVGPQLTDGRQDTQPLLTKELTAFLHDQRQASQANEGAIAALFQAVERLAQRQRVLVEQGRATDAPGREGDAGPGIAGPLPPAEADFEPKVKED